MDIYPLPQSPKYRLATTEQFKFLDRDSRYRNRGPTKELIAALDPDGIHVAGWQFIHNDVEYRTRWYVKLKDQTEAVELWMDNSFEAFDRHTALVEE